MSIVGKIQIATMNNNRITAVISIITGELYKINIRTTIMMDKYNNKMKIRVQTINLQGHLISITMTMRCRILVA